MAECVLFTFFQISSSCLSLTIELHHLILCIRLFIFFAYISLNGAKYAKIIAKETVETFANWFEDILSIISTKIACHYISCLARCLWEKTWEKLKKKKRENWREVKIWRKYRVIAWVVGKLGELLNNEIFQKIKDEKKNQPSLFEEQVGLFIPLKKSIGSGSSSITRLR